MANKGTKVIRCQYPRCDKDITQKIKVRTIEGKILCEKCNLK